jgi:predicted N-acetyltransferase YhbS
VIAVAAGATVELRVFESGDATAFRELNEAWITRLFSLVEHDHKVLGDPVGQIIEPGGQIIVAVDAGRVVGCCALVPMEPGVFEMAKLAVAEDCQGRGIGRKLLERTIQ